MKGVIMAARNIFRIDRRHDKWTVQKGNHVLAEYRTKKEAESAGRELMNKRLSSELLVYRPGGSIESRMTNFSSMNR